MFQKTKKLVFLFLLLFVFFSFNVFSVDLNKYVINNSSLNTFPIATKHKLSPLLVSSNDHAGVLRIIKHLQSDIKNVTGIEPKLFQNKIENTKTVIIIGTLGKSSLIDQLAKEGKIDASMLAGKWEKFTTQIVKNPFAGIDQALVIAGSDKRGTIYGMYDLSNQIGVSPWYWWADVPVKKQKELHVLPGIHTDGEPKVKYRGIFINDEAPALAGWAYEKYGEFNAEFYDKVFELILRMKGNYLWSAMWGRMFYVNDPNNPKLADEYGIVMGTSHHEPLARAHAEWEKFGKGKWDYRTNSENLIKFWREGMKRRGNTETIITIGMRGDGDEPMTEGTAIELLENIVKKQREIIAETTGKPAEETPQIWALYKEVQDYYEKGMSVPDDVTLLLADDNWGNIRKLPELNSAPRKGGYGIYYHYDYVGGPRNYKWLNTNQIERVWEQMHLAYEFGAKEMWLVNVGDIKPMEFPTEFFLDYAWNPEAWNAENLDAYYLQWSNEAFGTEHGKAIAEIIKKYTKYNARRKPELIDPQTYSLIHYNEADRIVNEYNTLAVQAEVIYKKLPKEAKDAYYQLVLHTVLACANLNELYVTAGKNHLYAKQGRAITNEMAEKVQKLFDKDAELTRYFHEELADGKWNHMMSQTHIGYTYWQQPDQNNIPKTQKIELPEKAEIGVAIDGSEEWFPEAKEEAILPTFDPFNNQTSHFVIFNRGTKQFNYEIKPQDKWVKISKYKGTIEKEEKFLVDIDWKKSPEGISKSQIMIEALGKQIPIVININNPNKANIKGFVESNGYISFAAENYSREISGGKFDWQIIPNLGKTLSGITPTPVAVAPQKISETSPRLEYDVHLFSKGSVKVHAYFSPTINFKSGNGLKYGIAMNDEKPQIINFNKETSLQDWEMSVANNIKVLTSEHEIKQTGNHTLKFYMIDSGLVLQKIVIETGDLKQTYLGPPESAFVK